MIRGSLSSEVVHGANTQYDIEINRLFGSSLVSDAEIHEKQQTICDRSRQKKGWCSSNEHLRIGTFWGNDLKI